MPGNVQVHTAFVVEKRKLTKVSAVVTVTASLDVDAEALATNTTPTVNAAVEALVGDLVGVDQGEITASISTALISAAAEMNGEK